MCVVKIPRQMMLHSLANLPFRPNISAVSAVFHLARHVASLLSYFYVIGSQAVWQPSVILIRWSFQNVGCQTGSLQVSWAGVAFSSFSHCSVWDSTKETLTRCRKCRPRFLPCKRVNALCPCLQGTSGPDPTTVYVDMRALRHDRYDELVTGCPCGPACRYRLGRGRRAVACAVGKLAWALLSLHISFVNTQ